MLLTFDDPPANVRVSRFTSVFCRFRDLEVFHALHGCVCTIYVMFVPSCRLCNRNNDEESREQILPSTLRHFCLYCGLGQLSKTGCQWLAGCGWALAQCITAPSGYESCKMYPSVGTTFYMSYSRLFL